MTGRPLQYYGAAFAWAKPMGVRQFASFNAPFLGEHQIFPRGDDVLVVVDEVLAPGGRVRFLQVQPHLGWVYDVLPRKGKRPQKRMLWPVAAPLGAAAAAAAAVLDEVVEAVSVQVRMSSPLAWDDSTATAPAAAPPSSATAASETSAAAPAAAPAVDDDGAESDATVELEGPAALPSLAPPFGRSPPRPPAPPRAPAVALPEDVDFAALILEEKCNAAEERARERAAHAAEVRVRQQRLVKAESGSWRKRMKAGSTKRAAAAARVRSTIRDTAAEKQKKNAERLLKVAENRSRTAADAVHARSMMLAERRARHMARFAGSPSLMLTNSPRSSRTRR